MTNKQKDYWTSFISGGCAGVCAKTVISPFERIKLLYLTRSTQFTYKAAIQDAIYVYQHHGFINFWRGNQANVLRIFPQSAINFSTFDYLRSRFAPDREDKTIIRKIRLFLCGLTSGIIAQSIAYPFDFLRTRLAMQKDAFLYKNIYDAAVKIYKIEGFMSFYSGLPIGIIGVGIYHGSGFFSFTLMKEYLLEQYPWIAKHKSTDFAIGASGAIIAQVLAYPFDIVKKRMQGQNVLLQQGEIQMMTSTWVQIKTIYKVEGIIKGFYKGVSLNFIKAPLSSGTAWTVKNSVNRLLNKNYDF
ncbi:unnamed protein product [Paramecium primaurelia]|uniref:Uncharacterized protein n=1 Tax=Paramecium primaurelia TaxID=5886 RepID=A0A8S1QDB2_PARPR|nr:unnamed protein product [Paramecium primaurelia]